MATLRKAGPFVNLPIEITSFGLPRDEWSRKVEKFTVRPCARHATACEHDRIDVIRTTHLRNGASFEQSEQITPAQLSDLYISMQP